VKISNKKFSFFSSLNQYFPHIPYVASKKLEKVALNTFKPSEFVVFHFVLMLLEVGNPHRYLQFDITAVKTSNFLP
jgi:hypothetical protein